MAFRATRMCSALRSSPPRLVRVGPSASAEGCGMGPGPKRPLPEWARSSARRRIAADRARLMRPGHGLRSRGLHGVTGSLADTAGLLHRRGDLHARFSGEHVGVGDCQGDVLGLERPGRRVEQQSDR